MTTQTNIEAVGRLLPATAAADLRTLAKYQLLDPLSAEEYAALEADIQKHGVNVAVEMDDQGNILDGHYRVEIARRHGLDYPKIVRQFASEQEKQEHAIKLNLLRRHMEPWRWGLAFKMLLEVKGIRRGEGGDRRSPDVVSGDTVEKVAASLGVDDRTARRRMKAADVFDAELSPMEQEQVRNRETTIDWAAVVMKREGEVCFDALRRGQKINGNSCR